ncbi:hypothetical protein MKMG_01259 [Methanogenium sp. MK-MG]|nr:hypothetical protein MKMG_01259 [Methanogenium sp. MK-MG]
MSTPGDTIPGIHEYISRNESPFHPNIHLGLRRSHLLFGGVYMESHKLYVGNINHSMTEENLREVFSGFGKLTSVKIIRDRGFGFVAYATLEEAEEARKAMAGKEFEGRTLRVEDARPIYQNERKP